MLYLLTIAQIGAVRLFSAKAREMHSCKARETMSTKVSGACYKVLHAALG